MTMLKLLHIGNMQNDTDTTLNKTTNLCHDGLAVRTLDSRHRPKPQTAAAAALCVTDRAGVQPISHRLSTRDFDLAQPRSAV